MPEEYFELPDTLTPAISAETGAGIISEEVTIMPVAESELSQLSVWVDETKVALQEDKDDIRKVARDAFTKIVKATYQDTFSLAHRLCGDDELAADITQEAYLRAYRGLSRFRGDSEFTTWMFRITTNVASTELGRRSRRRHEHIDDMPDDLLEDTRSVPVGDKAEHAELRQKVADALRTLPPRLRAVVVLRDIYDLPHEEIMKELGISESASKVRLHRARRKLRDGVFPDPKEY